jgi:hypothetical protein
VVQFDWKGLTELRTALQQLPEALTGEAEKIVTGHANGAAVFIRSAYPWYTGNLRKGVTVEVKATKRFEVNARIKSAAPHAWIFENGTEARKTKHGWNRGRMPAGRVFIPAMIRYRARVYTDLAALLERHGMRVTGAAA